MGTIARMFDVKDWHRVQDAFENGPVSAEGLQLAKDGVAMTVEEDGSVMGCGGVLTTGELWLRLSRKSNPRTAIEAIVAGINSIKKSFEDTELWCRVKIGWREGERFVKWLGLRRDRIENGYGVYVWQK